MPFQRLPGGLEHHLAAIRAGVGFGFISREPALQSAPARIRFAITAPQRSRTPVSAHLPLRIPESLAISPLLPTRPPPAQRGVATRWPGPQGRGSSQHLWALLRRSGAGTPARASHNPSKLPRGANSKFAGPAAAATAASSRPWARSPQSVRSSPVPPLGIPPTSSAAGKRRQVPPSPGDSSGTSAPAETPFGQPPQPRAGHAHSPARARAAIFALTPGPPPPGSVGAAAAATAAAVVRGSGYVTSDDAPPPAPPPRPPPPRAFGVLGVQLHSAAVYPLQEQAWRAGGTRASRPRQGMLFLACVWLCVDGRGFFPRQASHLPSPSRPGTEQTLFSTFL